jgi:hypothetical protein
VALKGLNVPCVALPARVITLFKGPLSTNPELFAPLLYWQVNNFVFVTAVNGEVGGVK